MRRTDFSRVKCALARDGGLRLALLFHAPCRRFALRPFAFTCSASGRRCPNETGFESLYAGSFREVSV